jgi:acetoin utilization deacetylase AcuC-like enzyme
MHIVWHPSSLKHGAGPGHPESPRRLEAILGALQAWEPAAALVWHEAEPVSDAAIRRVHAEPYLERLAAVAARGGGALDADTAMNEHSLVAARHAAGAAVAAVRFALSGEPAFAPVRPPGHHATHGRAMGFCLINNVVVAARAALEEMDLERVLIVDCAMCRCTSGPSTPAPAGPRNGERATSSTCRGRRASPGSAMSPT